MAYSCTIPMENPCCSCKLTRGHQPELRKRYAFDRQFIPTQVIAAVGRSSVTLLTAPLRPY